MKYTDAVVRSDLTQHREPDGELSVPRQIKTLTALVSAIGAAFNPAEGLRESLQRCTRAIVDILDVPFVRIWMLNDKTQVLELQASAGMHTHLDGPHSRVPIGHLTIGRIAMERRPHVTNSVIGDPDFCDQEWAGCDGMVAFAGHPLICRDGVAGVVALVSRQPLTVSTVAILATVADCIATGICHWRAVEALRVSERNLNDFFENGAIGLHWVGPDGIVLRVNQTELQLLGYERDEYVGHHICEFHADPELTEQILPRLADGETLRDHESRMLCKDGNIRHVLINSNVYYQDGKFIHTRSFTRDITHWRISQRRQAAVHEVTRILAEGTDVAIMMPRILRAVCENLEWNVGEHWGLKRKSGVLSLDNSYCRTNCSIPTLSAASHGLTFSYGIGLPGRAWASGKPEWIEDFAQDDTFRRTDAALNDNLRSAIAVPILLGSDVHGVMTFLHSSIPRPDDELLQTLDDISGQIGRCIDFHRSRHVLDRQRYELSIARALQQSWLPSATLRIPGVDLGGASVPASETGGDYFDFIRFSDEHVLVAVGDVSGHGLGPAMIMADARASLRALALTRMNIDSMVNLVNVRICEDSLEDTFFTLFLALLNPYTHSLTYYNAGHCPGFLFGPDGTVKLKLDSTDFPIGLFRDHVYNKSSVAQLESGDLLVMLTDGVFEAMSPSGDMFGMPRVLQLIRDCLHLEASQIVATLIETVQTFAVTALKDDVTAVVVKVV